MNLLTIQYLGRVSYYEGLAIQQNIWKKRLAGKIGDTLLLLEHESVFTIGRRDSAYNMLVPEKMLGAPVVRCDRGGEMTYHGPGQLVGYFHAKIGGPKETRKISGVKELVYGLEEVIILLLRKRYNLQPWRDTQHRGVWLGKEKHQDQSCDARKIAALGISIKQGISMHGFALNISTDLCFFQRIIPCGISERSVTNLEKELDSSHYTPTLLGVAEQLPEYFCSVFLYTESLYTNQLKRTET